MICFPVGVTLDTPTIEKIIFLSSDIIYNDVLAVERIKTQIELFFEIKIIIVFALNLLNGFLQDFIGVVVNLKHFIGAP